MSFKVCQFQIPACYQLFLHLKKNAKIFVKSNVTLLGIIAYMVNLFVFHYI